MERNITHDAIMAATAGPDYPQGNISEFARRLNVDRQKIQYWLRVGRPSPEYCYQIQEMTGIPVHVLRPDIFQEHK